MEMVERSMVSWGGGGIEGEINRQSTDFLGH